jgi:hypothetical protein
VDQRGRIKLSIKEVAADEGTDAAEPAVDAESEDLSGE